VENVTVKVSTFLGMELNMKVTGRMGSLTGMGFLGFRMGGNIRDSLKKD